jgi:hypothetical protein
VRITESVPGRQIASAREAARRAREQLGEAKVAGALAEQLIGARGQALRHLLDLLLLL